MGKEKKLDAKKAVTPPKHTQELTPPHKSAVGNKKKKETVDEGNFSDMDENELQKEIDKVE